MARSQREPEGARRGGGHDRGAHPGELRERPRPGSGRGDTRLFIRPGYAFRVVDALVTNFHLPRSTLSVVSEVASAGPRPPAYRAAKGDRHRLSLFSYGDAMLLARRQADARLARFELLATGAPRPPRPPHARTATSRRRSSCRSARRARSRR